ncbi:DUF1585 domain-containing protein, partial [Akkermansiaceae bacterium]|nr:DUF1585 domain-containing protein [Akkermansiaceae bacterium]
IVPDLANAKTPKELLIKHRESPKCFSCHKLMDPAGLALESFDIIGRFRENYSRKLKVETAGEYAGTSFEDIRGLRKALMNDKDVFTYNFIIKLAEYAKGRKLNRADKDIVKVIAQKAKYKYNYKLMNIMAELLVSDLMTHR